MLNCQNIFCPNARENRTDTPTMFTGSCPGYARPLAILAPCRRIGLQHMSAHSAAMRPAQTDVTNVTNVTGHSPAIGFNVPAWTAAGWSTHC